MPKENIKLNFPVNYWKGKKRKPFTEEHRKKLSESHKGYKMPNKQKMKISHANKGKKKSPLTEEHKRKLSESHKGNLHSENEKRKISESLMGHIVSKETGRKISEAKTGKKRPPCSEETKIKLREARFKYIKKSLGIVYPIIGRNEKQILDELEKELGYRIIRQYKVGGYHLDGYIPEINLAIEVDEKYHNRKYIKEKETKREEFIKEKLGCQFYRIKDYNDLKNK